MRPSSGKSSCVARTSGCARERRLAAADRDVVAVEGDVDGAERGRDAGALLDQAREPLRERDAAGLDPDERDVVELGVALDDLVGDSRKSPPERVRVEERSSPESGACVFIRLLSGLAGPG